MQQPVSTLLQHGEINIAPLTASTLAEVDAAMRISVHPCRIGAAALKLMHLCHFGTLQCTLPKNSSNLCRHCRNMVEKKKIALLTAGTHAEVDAAMRISVHPCRIGAAALKLMHVCRLQCTLPENATARVDIVATW